MEPTGIYALCFFGVFVTAFVVNQILPKAALLGRNIVILAYKTLSYLFLIDRHALLGPLTALDMLIYAAYLCGNVAILWYGVKTLPQASSRAGTMALINLGPVYLGVHIAFLADLFSVSVTTYRDIHRACGLTATAHLLFHGVVALSQKPSLTLDSQPRLYASIGAALTVTLVLLALPLLRRRVFELFLRMHQVLAAAVVVCVVQHLRSLKRYDWLPIYVFAGTVCFLEATRIGLVAFQNKRLAHPCSRIMFRSDNGIVKATIILSRPLRVDAGQYINLWVPSVSLFSNHPFSVTSWASTPQKTVELLIQPRRGFTKALFHRASVKEAQHISSRTVLSRHGRSVPVWDYECVLMFATGFGIAAMIPFLRKLLHGYRERKGITKRMHLVWQVKGLDLRAAVKPIIDDLLGEDDSNPEHILFLSIYNELDMEKDSSPHHRFSINPGRVDVFSVIDAEISGTVMKPSSRRLPVIQEEPEPSSWRRWSGSTLNDAMLDKVTNASGLTAGPNNGGRTLVLVSAEGTMRDNLRRAARKHLSNGVRLHELDYQPE